MAEDGHRHGLHEREPQGTSPAVKMLGYGAIAVLLLAIILFATGIIKFGPF